MIKTTTPNDLVSSPSAQATECASSEAEQQDELFYNSIKSRLNELIKNPSEETIDRILAYSKDK